LGSISDVAILRFYPWMADQGTVATLSWMARDQQLGARNYALREAYEWVDAHTPADIKLQFNPQVELQDTPAFLYNQRQLVASNDPGCLANFGGDAALCQPLLTALAALYAKHDQPAPSSIGEACQALPVNILVAKDTDAAWRNRESWVWREQPIFSNTY